jgi:hypothetical protein
MIFGQDTDLGRRSRSISATPSSTFDHTHWRTNKDSEKLNLHTGGAQNDSIQEEAMRASPTVKANLAYMNIKKVAQKL